MKIRKTLTFAIFLLVALTATSCLGDNDYDYTYTDDTAITSFTLGTLKRTIHTTSSTGEDSTYTTTVDCSDYVFYIDQATNTVYNPDSLPLGTDNAHALVSVGTKNSGVAYLKSLTSDTLYYISSSDSLDFSQPRTVRIYSNSGQAFRNYTVHVNVHQQEADTCIWTQLSAVEAFARMTNMKAVALGGQLTVFGTIDGTLAAVATKDNGATWSALTFNFNETPVADAHQGIVVKDDYLYMINGTSLLRSADAATWEVVATAAGLKQLVAASRARLYAYATDGRLMASADNGQTWTVSTVDDELSLLPTENLSYVCSPLTTNEGADRVVLLGLRDSTVFTTDVNAMVWGKIDETDDLAQEQPWSYYGVSSKNRRALPCMAAMKAAAYDDAIVLVGGASTKGRIREAFDSVYVSRDKGLTWIGDTTLYVPADFVASMRNAGGTPNFAFASDEKNYLWLIDGNNGTVWRGRINRLGWAEEKTAYTK